MIKIKARTIIFTTLATGICYSYFGRIETSRNSSPDGKYHAVISHRPMYYIPLPLYRWGNHSDSPAFVSIEGTKGKQYGEVPVPMLQMADVDWGSNSASITLIAEWDFIAETCFYWSSDQSRKIYIK